MAIHKVRITQVSRVVRSIVVEVEADTIADAIERQNEETAPSLGDPRWKVDVDSLQNEEVEPA